VEEAGGRHVSGNGDTRGYPFPEELLREVVAGEVSRQLNSIVNLGIIDDTLARVARRVHRARTRLEVSEEELTKAKQEHDDLAWVPDFTAAVEALNAQEADYAEKRDRAATAAELLQAIQSHQATLQNAADAATRGRILVETGDKALAAQGRASLIHSLIAAARRHETAAGVVVPDTGAMEAALTKHKASKNKATALQGLIDTIHEREDELCQLEKELKAAEKAVPKTCPTCGRSS
jgi:DNA repair exonuclease SbcCD ATPase subunit